jgi:hypothetical protein
LTLSVVSIAGMAATGGTLSGPRSEVLKVSGKDSKKVRNAEMDLSVDEFVQRCGTRIEKCARRGGDAKACSSAPSVGADSIEVVVARGPMGAVQGESRSPRSEPPAMAWSSCTCHIFSIADDDSEVVAVIPALQEIYILADLFEGRNCFVLWHEA